MNAISVLTCAARGQYLAQTIASIDRAGGTEFEGPKSIHIDGPVPDDMPHFKGWQIVSLSEKRRGARMAMVDVMAREYTLGADTLLYFEDDVVLCKNAIRAMLEIGVPEPLGFVSYCDLKWDGKPLELVAFPGCPRDSFCADGGFLGCQALAVPARTLERFVTLPVPDWIDRNNCDSTMAIIADAYGIFDSLADHVGKTSAIVGRDYETLRVVRGWRGEDFDADQVPRTFTLNDLGTRCAYHQNVLHEDRLACPRR
jgi:hypothetical protein